MSAKSEKNPFSNTNLTALSQEMDRGIAALERSVQLLGKDEVAALQRVNQELFESLPKTPTETI